MKLKVEGKTWAQIAQELGGGRVKHDITRRHKQLTSVSKGEEREEKGGEKDGGKADNDDKEEENEKEKTPAKMSKKEKKAAKAEKDREEGLKRKEEMVKKKETEEMKAAVEAKEPPAEPEPAKVCSLRYIVLVVANVMNSLQQTTNQVNLLQRMLSLQISGTTNRNGLQRLRSTLTVLASESPPNKLGKWSSGRARDAASGT